MSRSSTSVSGANAGAGRYGSGTGSEGKRANSSCRLLLRRQVLEVACQEGAAARGRPAPLAERNYPFARKAAEVLLQPQHCAPQWVLAEGSPIDQILSDHRRLVIRAVDLLDHHAALAVELLSVQARASHEVAQQVDRLWRTLRAHRDVERHHVMTRVRVEHAAEPLGRLVDVLVRRVLLSALEHQVLEEVGHPVLLWALVARARVKRHQHRQRARAWQLDAVNRQPVCLDCGGLDGGHC